MEEKVKVVVKVVDVGEKVLVFKFGDKYYFIEDSYTPEVGDKVPVFRTSDGKMVTVNPAVPEVGDEVIVFKQDSKFWAVKTEEKCIDTKTKWYFVEEIKPCLLWHYPEKYVRIRAYNFPCWESVCISWVWHVKSLAAAYGPGNSNWTGHNEPQECLEQPENNPWGPNVPGSYVWDNWPVKPAQGFFDLILELERDLTPPPYTYSGGHGRIKIWFKLSPSYAEKHGFTQQEPDCIE